MIDAIKESKRGAITVTKRTTKLQYEPPSIVICPHPSFKLSISKKYNVKNLVRDIFIQGGY